MKVEIKAINDTNKPMIRQLFIDNWNSDIMVTKGQIHKFEEVEGFIAINNNKIIGVLTFKRKNQSVELISLDSFKENKGIGTQLLNRLVEYVKNKSVHRLWLITTNDNLNALKFYQKRKWTLKNIYPNAVKEARKLKPTIPIIGNDGIEIRHELELEYEP
jgi:ribosomal protein S18 acetylase RimI-like enzyme